ncbi:MAG: eCIS core domain-containing protein [Ilyomonas sp.]
MLKVRVKENSALAKIAAKKLGEKRVALVVGTTIHLWNTSKKEFLNNEKWVRHELAHVHQYKQHGIFGFLTLYLFESIKKGYYRNKFEAAAREKENDTTSTEVMFIE